LTVVPICAARAQQWAITEIPPGFIGDPIFALSAVAARTGSPRRSQHMSSTGLDQKPLTVSVRRARQLLDVGKTKIFEMIDDGRLRTIKIDRKRLIIYSSIEALIESKAA
jgi:excisionase family DNA binding protein